MVRHGSRVYMQKLAKSRIKRTGKLWALAAIVALNAGVAKLGFWDAVRRGETRASEEIMRDGIGENEGYEGRESKDEDGVHDAKILRVIGRKSLGTLWGHLRLDDLVLIPPSGAMQHEPNQSSCDWAEALVSIWR
jgi:hypothetical protein